MPHSRNPRFHHFFAQYSQSGNGTETPFEVAKTPLPITHIPPVIQPQHSASEKDKSEFTESENGFTITDSILALSEEKIMDARRQAGQRTTMPIETLVVDSLFAGEVDRLHQQSREQDRHVFITSSTRESPFAAYMEAWRLTVERIGTLDYPDVAKQYEVNGALVLDVAIGRNGQLMEARLIRSSGNKRLDGTAIRIAILAAPFIHCQQKSRVIPTSFISLGSGISVRAPV